MTHGVSFIDEYRHNPGVGRRTVPGTGCARMPRAGRDDVRQAAGFRYR